MSDPTYDRELIDANPIWRTAFHLSEMINDSAPIGWGKYIYIAKCMHDIYHITRKDEVQCPEKAIMSVFEYGRQHPYRGLLGYSDTPQKNECYKDQVIDIFKENLE